MVGGGRRTREGSLPVCAVKSQPSDGDAAVPCFSFHPHPLGLQREGGREGELTLPWSHPPCSLSLSLPSASLPLFHAQSIWNVHVESIKASQMAQLVGNAVKCVCGAWAGAMPGR